MYLCVQASRGQLCKKLWLLVSLFAQFENFAGEEVGSATPELVGNLRFTVTLILSREVVITNGNVKRRC